MNSDLFLIEKLKITDKKSDFDKTDKKTNIKN